MVVETNALEGQLNVPLRSPEVVMDLPRLGSLYPYRLSFMRCLIRRMMKEKWHIEQKIFDLDQNGYGVGVYEIRTPHNLFSFVAFAHYLDPEMRSDRVIAEAWDTTVTLCEGGVDEARLEELRANVPLQEKGRLDDRCIVLSRANKSARNFDYVAECLAEGKEPSWDQISQVGYLCRTTAVYGSGKFGMADWEKVSSSYPDFARPFAAEMFTCFMIRHFSIEQVEHIAKARAPKKAVPMSDALKRYLGIGNATGLGMAPFLVNHPLLISRWIEVREIALARVLSQAPKEEALADLSSLTEKAILHLSEIETDNHDQRGVNERTAAELVRFKAWFTACNELGSDWKLLTQYVEKNFSVETQELVHTILMEIYPELIDDLEDMLNLADSYPFNPDMSASQLIDIIKDKYGWALSYDFEKPEVQGVFWYRSEEKMEPRLGQRGAEAGGRREMAMGIARSVRNCFDALEKFVAENADDSSAHFVMTNPEHRLIVRRIQTMAKTIYGDIRANLLEQQVEPIHLLRCKLSFFGVGRFDPRSRLWVRNVMFQGAPICSDIGHEFEDHWCFPTKLGSGGDG